MAFNGAGGPNDARIADSSQPDKHRRYKTFVPVLFMLLRGNRKKILVCKKILAVKTIMSNETLEKIDEM